MRRFLIAVIVVGMVACGQAVGAPKEALPSARPFHPPSSWGLFLTADNALQEQSWPMTRLDAATLFDAQPAGQRRGYVIASADGSTLVEIDYNADNTTVVRVIDARTGQLRGRFQPPFADGAVLTADGSRLLVNESIGLQYRVFDTSTGRQTGSVQTSDAICCGGVGEWLDPTGRFLYGISVPGSGLGATGPGTPVLVRYDLQTGKEDGRLVLKGIQAGVWAGTRTINGEHVAETLLPGAALRPDGAQLALLYDDGNRLMTIDAIHMTVITSRPVGLPPQSTGWLGLVPVDAEAKFEDGTTWNLTYSPDGKRLLATAEQTTVDDSGNQQTQGLGVRLIDVASSTVISEVKSVDLPWAAFAPDGSAVYGMRWPRDNPETVHSVLMRLDARTLAVAARREFTGSRSVLILAR